MGAPIDTNALFDPFNIPSNKDHGVGRPLEPPPKKKPHWVDFSIDGAEPPRTAAEIALEAIRAIDVIPNNQFRTIIAKKIPDEERVGGIWEELFRLMKFGVFHAPLTRAIDYGVLPQFVYSKNEQIQAFKLWGNRKLEKHLRDHPLDDIQLDIEYYGKAIELANSDNKNPLYEQLIPLNFKLAQAYLARALSDEKLKDSFGELEDRLARLLGRDIQGLSGIDETVLREEIMNMGLASSAATQVIEGGLNIFLRQEDRFKELALEYRNKWDEFLKPLPKIEEMKQALLKTPEVRGDASLLFQVNSLKTGIKGIADLESATAFLKTYLLTIDKADHSLATSRLLEEQFAAINDIESVLEEGKELFQEFKAYETLNKLMMDVKEFKVQQDTAGIDYLTFVEKHPKTLGKIANAFDQLAAIEKLPKEFSLFTEYMEMIRDAFWMRATAYERLGQVLRAGFEARYKQEDIKKKLEGVFLRYRTSEEFYLRAYNDYSFTLKMSNIQLEASKLQADIRRHQLFIDNPTMLRPDESGEFVEGGNGLDAFSLPPTASNVDNYYRGMTLYLMNLEGRQQAYRIISYDASTKRVTIDGLVFGNPRTYQIKDNKSDAENRWPYLDDDGLVQQKKREADAHQAMVAQATEGQKRAYRLIQNNENISEKGYKFCLELGKKEDPANYIAMGNWAYHQGNFDNPYERYKTAYEYYLQGLTLALNKKPADWIADFKAPVQGKVVEGTWNTVDKQTHAITVEEAHKGESNDIYKGRTITLTNGKGITFSATVKSSDSGTAKLCFTPGCPYQMNEGTWSYEINDARLEGKIIECRINSARAGFMMKGATNVIKALRYLENPELWKKRHKKDDGGLFARKVDPMAAMLGYVSKKFDEAIKAENNALYVRLIVLYGEPLLEDWRRRQSEKFTQMLINERARAKGLKSNLQWLYEKKAGFLAQLNNVTQADAYFKFAQLEKKYSIPKDDYLNYKLPPVEEQADLEKKEADEKPLDFRLPKLE